jgi:Ca2+-binding EF-hand superfamily protein
VHEGEFSAKDTDHDERLSPSEWGLYDGSRPVDLAKPEFERIDSDDDDGAIDVTEYCWAADNPASPPPTPGERSCRDLLLSKDGNGDGQLNWEEFYAYALEVQGRSTEQKQAIYEEWQVSDRNQSGGVGPAELCTDEPPPPATPVPTPGCRFEFAAVDTDGDGAVTRAEHDASVPPVASSKSAIRSRTAQIEVDFQAWDTDRDGRLMPGEICNE